MARNEDFLTFGDISVPIIRRNKSRGYSGPLYRSGNKRGVAVEV